MVLTKKKILLIKSWWPYPCDDLYSTYNRVWPPLCLANAAALLERDGFGVDILDAHALRIRPAEIHKYIRGYEKIFITSTSLDRWLGGNINVDPFLETTRIIREHVEDFFVSGFHATVEPERIISMTGAKAVICGEPEMAILDVCRGRKFCEIGGLAYKDNGKFTMNARQVFPLESLPEPSYHHFKSGMYQYEILGKNFFLFETSRGCPFPCKFCDKVMFNSKFRSKNPEQVIRELDMAINKFGIRHGYFIDLNFTLNHDMVVRVCDYLEKNITKGFKWCCQTRVDLLTEDLLKRMARSGCRIIHVGVESGSPKVLNSLHKDFDFERTKVLFDCAHELGIKTVCFFIFGSPGEGCNDRQRTIKLARKLLPTYAVFRIWRELLLHENVYELKKAVRKATLGYYLNMTYLMKRFAHAGPWEIAREAFLFIKMVLAK